jgi:6-phosphofructokinase
MKWSMDEVLKAVKERVLTKHHCLIVVSEGAGQELLAAEKAGEKDKSGNKKYGVTALSSFRRTSQSI